MSEPRKNPRIFFEQFRMLGVECFIEVRSRTQLLGQYETRIFTGVAPPAMGGLTWTMSMIDAGALNRVLTRAVAAGGLAVQKKVDADIEKSKTDLDPKDHVTKEKPDE